jgi:hypothetical protein
VEESQHRRIINVLPIDHLLLLDIFGWDTLVVSVFGLLLRIWSSFRIDGILLDVIGALLMLLVLLFLFKFAVSTATLLVHVWCSVGFREN